MIAVRTHARASVPTILVSCTLALLVTACGSDKEPTETSAQHAASTTAPASTNAPITSAGPDDISNWVETESSPAPPASATSDRIADPDAVIARYQRECPKGTQTPECRALRLDVEAIFLDALVGVRATNAVVDPRWYRLAAGSETPQLACIGVMELIWDRKRTAQDEALIARALDSRYPSVRNAVLSNWRLVPDLQAAMKRNGGFDYGSLSGVCVDSTRDAVPGTKWAGGYPGAQFRPFASNDSRRWFTTPDPPEKVIAWFEARGKVARTGPQLMADSQARLMEEMIRLSSNPEEDNTEKIMALVTSQGSEAHWSEPFRDIEGTGEIKYVMIGANQAIAIFEDDFLKATSIVAIQPKEPMDLTPDIEALTEEQEMRRIFGI